MIDRDAEAMLADIRRQYRERETRIEDRRDAVLAVATVIAMCVTLAVVIAGWALR